jgi:enamine deaminase RidA (YjgF/YER057c/UK114 family)
MMQPINPAELGAPRGYSNGMLAAPGGRILFVAGQIGWDREQKLVSSEFLPQFAQALRNVLTVVREAGGRAEHIGRLTLYVVERGEYLRDIKQVGEHYRALMGRHYPAMALVEVKSLLEPLARVEIEATAVIP